MSAKQSLGRGFDALIPKDLDATILGDDTARIQNLLITDIIPNPEQPRRQFEQTSINELANSIKKHGVMQPIIVVRHGEGYRIVAGERRWRAATSAKLKTIPAIVRSLKELEQIELALIENIQRVDLSPLEQALAVYRLQHQFNLSLEQVAQRLGKAVSTVSNLGRLLQLPPSAREALASGKISEGHARAILALKGSQDLQEELLSSILNNNLSVRDAESFVINKRKTATNSTKDFFDKRAAELSAKMRSNVKIRHSSKGGQIIISFKDNDELDRISKFIKDNKLF